MEVGHTAHYDAELAGGNDKGGVFAGKFVRFIFPLILN